VRVSLLGYSGSGKSTLLGALTLALLQGDTDSDLVLFSMDGAETTRDLTGLAETLQGARWPAPTARDEVREYALRLRHARAGAVFSLRLPELSGSLLEEVWRNDRLPAKAAFMRDADAQLVLVDASVRDPDKMVAHYVHLLQGLKRARGYAPHEVALEPLGVVLTKWDTLRPEDQGRGADVYARECLPLLLDFVASNFATSRWFSASAVGEVDDAGRPALIEGRIRPHNVFAPLAWLTDEVHGLS
jgi:energy-coupling factor transporter ATP-binding protein EcfA2